MDRHGKLASMSFANCTSIDLVGCRLRQRPHPDRPLRRPRPRILHRPGFEAELTFEVKDEKGQPVRFGSVGGGGRYDGLVARFRGEHVPATGFSIGVSRLQAALHAARQDSTRNGEPGPVVVLGDGPRPPRRLPEHGADAARRRHPRRDVSRHAGMNSAQMKYADKRNAPCVVIQGSDEQRARARCRSRT